MDNTITTLWNHILKDMKGKVSMGNFATLFNHSALMSLENDTATIATPTIMALDMLQKRFYTDIKAILDKQTGKDNNIHFIIKTVAEASNTATGKEKGAEENLFSSPSEQPKKATGQTEIKQQPAMIGHLPRVLPEYTFSTLAVSDSNRLAFETARTISQNPGKIYNPFFMYGPVGVGKTHLMHAIANEVYRKNPDRKVIYITSEEFTNEVVEGIRNNETSKMKRRFRSASLLLIDDIQFIEGKDRVQEELFHTFNILIDQGSQIALSSDRPPHEIKKLEKRLSSRFAGGLTVDIQSPDFELKTAILLKKAEKFNQVLPIEIAKMIANGAEDTRSLEGLLLRVITTASSLQSEITIEIAQRALGTVVEEKKGSLHADDVVKEVCRFYNIKPTQLKGPKRDAALVKARQIAMFLLYNDL